MTDGSTRNGNYYSRELPPPTCLPFCLPNVTTHDQISQAFHPYLYTANTGGGNGLEGRLAVGVGSHVLSVSLMITHTDMPQWCVGWRTKTTLHASTVRMNHTLYNTNLVQVMPECLFDLDLILLHQSAEVPQLLDAVLLWQCLVAAEARTETRNNLSQAKMVYSQQHSI